MLKNLIREGEDIKSSLIYNNEPYFESYELPDTFLYESWKNKVIRYLSSSFEGDRCIDDFEKNIIFFEKNNSPSNFNTLLGLLSSLSEFSTLIPSKIGVIKDTQNSSRNNIVINNNNNNENNNIQNQILEIFLESITDEITGKQLKELKEISKIEPNSMKAKSKIIDNIKGFGEDVMTNIISNMITNPSIWTGLSNL